MFVRWSVLTVLLSALLLSLGCGSGEVAPRDDLPSDEIPANIEEEMSPEYRKQKIEEAMQKSRGG
jgi:hypothetical protein